jgi:hypothetical protein
MKPIRRKAQPVCIFMTVLMLLISIPYQSVLAKLVETETVLETSRGQEARDYLKQVLSRGEVRSALIAQGIDPLEAEARLDSLTDSEVIQLADQIELLPAGGDAVGLIIAVLIIVVLVLVIIKLI